MHSFETVVILITLLDSTLYWYQQLRMTKPTPRDHFVRAGHMSHELVRVEACKSCYYGLFVSLLNV